MFIPSCLLIFISHFCFTQARPTPRSTAEVEPTCLSAVSALQITSNFGALLTTYSNTTAASYLHPDFTAYSDSTTSLMNSGCPSGPMALGSPLFASLAAFQSGQSHAANMPFEVLNVWFGCDSVTVRWRSAAPVVGATASEQVIGIAVLQVVQGCVEDGEEEWIVKALWQEFNSLAWAVDAGMFTPNCGAV
ncbi:unnamed protein product [Zymoseptoria tritici ST99CH_3D1]|uniref:NTF2-like domain-containing protein n=1 Tax=Zymoseptoria tritici ST99CH_1E4 TaxID=1276532 RepID=A0A2H1GTC4_ZYMTR|nr:unnamed protein product [Zymoseptoria tritici ST99CH_1E4]SMR59669.1 unnamed protein product [Zymoseptoria tritici ST99CH_3D1]